METDQLTIFIDISAGFGIRQQDECKRRSSHTDKVLTALMIDGYNDDTREIYAIQEVRTFYKQLWKVWPYWLYFCNLDTENLMLMVMCCLDSLDALKVKGQSQVKISFNPLEVVQFVSGGFVPMNEMCERAGMSERQIFERTKAVFEYFSLPFDAELPG